MNRLAELRKEKHLKQSELAEIVGTTQQTISAYERDAYAQKDSELEEKLADFFSCSLDYLRGLSGIRNSEQLIENSILLKNEFVKLGIIKEDEDISEEMLNYFRDLIKLHKPFLMEFAKKHSASINDDSKTEINSEKEDSNNTDKE